MTILVSDITYTIGPIVFGGTDSNGVTWYIGDPTGGSAAGTTGWYDGAPVRLNQTPIPRYDGAYRANSYRGPKVIILTGSVNAPTKPLAQAARDQFQGLFANGTQQVMTVVDGAQTRTMTVELGADPKAAVHEGGGGFDFQLTLSAVDPRKYGAAQTASTGLPAVSQVGVSWGTPPGTTAGVVWGTPPGSGVGVVWGNYGSSGLVSLSNQGFADAWPAFTVTGPVTAPSITDSAGNLLAWTGPALGTADVLVITPSPFGPRSVLLNGGDNRASLTTAQWAPVAGRSSQTWQFQGTSAGVPTLTVSLPPAYW